MKNQFKTIVVSDLHLGAKNSKTKELINFLKQYKCETLILNGDIIDGHQLKKLGELKKKHTRFFTRILKLIQDNHTNIIYVLGNQDAFLSSVAPFTFGNIRIVQNYTYHSNGKTYFVTHGDLHDQIVSNYPLLTKLGVWGYRLIIKLHQWLKLPVLAGTDHAISASWASNATKGHALLNMYKRNLTNIARCHHCDGVICGHIHQPSIAQVEHVLYLNSGDWVNSLSALAEDYNGDWSLIFYNESPKSQKTSQIYRQPAFKKTVNLGPLKRPSQVDGKIEFNAG